MRTVAKHYPRIVRVHQLKPGDRFNFIPADWYGPGVVTEAYGERHEVPAYIDDRGVVGTWTLKFDNSKVVNPPGVWYGHPDTKVRLLSGLRLK